MNFGDKMEELRRLRGMSRKELADLVGVTTRTIEHYAKCEREPIVSVALRIAYFLGVSMEELCPMPIELPSRYSVGMMSRFNIARNMERAV